MKEGRGLMTGEHSSASEHEIRELMGDIIDGRIVKRSKHQLTLDSRDLSQAFIAALHERGYVPMLVRDVDIIPGERVPGFVIDSGTAYFGWVFWEKFSQLRLRKLFGSVVRNSKGDWAIQIPPERSRTVYVNTALRMNMDIDAPSGF